MESSAVNNMQWQAVRTLLTARRAELNEEISAYPGPITGCDAQFNHLLELRADLNVELALFSQMSEGGDARTLERFVAACPFLVQV